jgi:flagellar hook protein FlgE
MTTFMDMNKRLMINALEKTLGVVTSACKIVGIARSTHYNWYDSDRDYRDAVDDISNIALDFAESKLHEMIQDKDTTATIFYLKTKGKKRGYIERNEIDHNGQIGIVWQEEKTYDS